MSIRNAVRTVVGAVPVVLASPALVLTIQGYMFLPVGVFAAIYAPWTPFARFPQTRWLVTHTIWMPRETRVALFYAGLVLVAVGLVVFLGSYVYFYSVRHRVGLVTGGPYAVVRHPQYLGIFLGLAGFSLIGVRPISVVAFVTAFCTYLALMIHEEGENEQRFGDAYRAYRARVPFLVPFLPRALTRPLAPLLTAPRPAQYLSVAVLYVVLVAGALVWLRDRAFPT